MKSDTGKLDSDKNILIKGKVIDVYCGKTQKNTSDTTKRELVTLVIETIEKDYRVDLPVEIKSDFDVIPFQIGLIGANVIYFKRYNTDDVEKFQHWRMEIFSGPLDGSKYKYSGP